MYGKPPGQSGFANPGSLSLTPQTVQPEQDDALRIGTTALGGVIGALAGSAVPGVGTAAGASAGMSLGGYLGGAIEDPSTALTNAPQAAMAAGGLMGAPAGGDALAGLVSSPDAAAKAFAEQEIRKMYGGF